MSRKDIRAVPANAGDLRGILLDLREAAQQLLGIRGDPLQRALTVGDVNGGSGGTGGGSIIVNPGGGVGEEPDLTPPPTPSGLTVSAGLTNVYVEWDVPGYTQGHGHGQANIYGVTWPVGDPAPVFADAVLIGVAPNALTLYAHPTDSATRWAIWLTWQSADGVESAAPAGGTNGQVATTGQNVDLLLQTLTGAITDGQLAPDFSFQANTFVIRPPDGSPVGIGDLLPFVVQTTDQTVNGVLIPKGVYMDAAFIKNLTALVARLGNAWIDDAKIANLSAAKLTAGTGIIGGDLRSTNFLTGSTGWRVRPDGTAEFSGVIVRGTVFATAGTIGGNTITSTAITSNGFVAGSVGYRFTSTGILEAYSGNGANRFNLSATGTTPVLKIGNALSVLGNGAATFAGTLQSTTFTVGVAGWRLTAAGVVEAYSESGDRRLNLSATGTTPVLKIENALTVLGNGTATFAGALAAASGTFAGTLTAAAVNAVNTINLAGEAVTVPAAGELASSVGLISTYTTIATCSVNSEGQPIAAFAGFDCVGGAGGEGSASVSVRLVIGGQVQRTITSRLLSANERWNAALVGLRAAPGTGSVTVSLQALGFGTATGGACTVVAIGTKR